MNNKLIPIFFTIDDGYAKFLAVAIKSLIENASKEYNYKIHVIHENLTEENKNKLKKLETDYAKIEFYEMDKRLECITDKMGTRLRADFFTLTIFFRLFIPEMFKEYDKCIYLDSDIVVPGDISKLYNIDLEDNLIGAVRDHSVVDVEPLCYYIENAIGVDRHYYINSGVLLLNSKKLREVKLDERFLYLFNKYHINCIAPDQDYLNAMCKGKIYYLDNTWDTMPAPGVKPIDNPELVHYNLFLKPWHYDNVDYEDYFWKYAKQVEYYEEIKKIKENYSDENKEEDSKHMELMVQNGLDIANSKNTFLNIFESGKESRL